MKKILFIALLIVIGSTSLECMLTGPGGEQANAELQGFKQKLHRVQQARRRVKSVLKTRKAAIRQRRKLKQQLSVANPEAGEAHPNLDIATLDNLLHDAEVAGFHGIYGAYAYFVKKMEAGGNIERFIESMVDNPFAERMAVEMAKIRHSDMKSRVERKEAKDRLEADAIRDMEEIMKRI